MPMFQFKFKPKKASQRSVVLHSIFAACLEVAYILFVALFFAVGSVVFSLASNVVMAMMAFLILLVLSVGVSAVLIFGYPLIYITQNKYKESLLSIVTIMITLLVIFTVLLIGAALTIKI